MSGIAIRPLRSGIESGRMALRRVSAGRTLCRMSGKVAGHSESARDLAGDRSPTDDDVPVTLDGRRLDTPEKVLAFPEKINAKRAATAPRAG